MGIRAFLHKIKTGFVRIGESALPCTSDAKRYGNHGEDNFTNTLRRELPSCKIKKNIIITTSEGNAEIDCLVLYKNKLFAIEVKNWKGRITEDENGFSQEKADRWTDEIHIKHLKSPFKQLSRAIYLLKRQIPVKAWVNPVVFFENNELESISTFTDNIIWFNCYQDLIKHISNEGEVSLGKNANDFFNKCVPADYLYSDVCEKSLHCIINRDTLQFKSPQGIIPIDSIVSIQIFHHWSYDELHIQMMDGTKQIITLENAKIQVHDNGHIDNYALCKLDYIELGIK